MGNLAFTRNAAPVHDRGGMGMRSRARNRMQRHRIGHLAVGSTLHDIGALRHALRAGPSILGAARRDRPGRDVRRIRPRRRGAHLGRRSHRHAERPKKADETCRYASIPKRSKLWNPTSNTSDKRISAPSDISNRQPCQRLRKETCTSRKAEPIEEAIANDVIVGNLAHTVIQINR